MPDLAALVASPAVGVGAAGAFATAPTVGGGATLLDAPADGASGSVPDFLSQLEAALVLLAVGSVQVVDGEGAQDPGPPGLSGDGADALPTAADRQDAPVLDDATAQAELAALLAVLGAALPVPLAPAASTAGSGGPGGSPVKGAANGAPNVPLAPPTPPAPILPPAAAATLPTGDTGGADALPTVPAPNPSLSLPPSSQGRTDVAPAPPTPPGLPGEAIPAAAPGAPAPSVVPLTPDAPAPSAAALRSAAPALLTAAASVASQPLPTSQGRPAGERGEAPPRAAGGATPPSAGAAGATTVLMVAQTGPSDGRADAQSDEPDDDGLAPGETSPLPRAPDDAERQSVASFGQVLSTHAGTGVDRAQAADAASQIARHADLYRLPGGHGVRIQLQPEGLGNVDVTVRYGPGHTVEMRLTVESASTGALVQAGWTDLRDALAAHGLAPDRLVVSVAAPVAAESSSFSGSGSGARQDAGAMGFGQGSAGRQNDGEPRSAHSRVANMPEAQLTAAEDPRPGAGESSRIDYRV